MSPLARFLAGRDPVAAVRIAAVEGSAPREAGAVMLVARDALHGTIGGGQLEYMAIDQARKLIARRARRAEMILPLGPEIGQCCGGRVTLALERLDEEGRRALLATEAAREAAARHVLIFGAGHTGRALAAALAPLPLRAVLIDGRAEELALAAPGSRTHLTALPEAKVAAAPPGAAFVALTHDHALDFLITAEALARGDAAYVGMIGSATKRAAFAGWLRRETGGEPTGLICPIGGAGKGDKRPEVIAAHVASEIAAALLDGADAGYSVTKTVGRR